MNKRNSLNMTAYTTLIYCNREMIRFFICLSNFFFIVCLMKYFLWNLKSRDLLLLLRNLSLMGTKYIQKVKTNLMVGRCEESYVRIMQKHQLIKSQVY